MVCDLRPKARGARETLVAHITPSGFPARVALKPQRLLATMLLNLAQTRRVSARPHVTLCAKSALNLSTTVTLLSRPLCLDFVLNPSPDSLRKHYFYFNEVHKNELPQAAT